MGVRLESFSFKNFMVIVVIHALAVPALWYINFENIILWLASHFFFATFGASIGLHRYFSHRAFQTNKKFEMLLAIAGTLCFQGSPFFWASVHREHHKKVEKWGDAHSAARGFFWSHIGWLFYKNPNGYSYLKSIKNILDLRKIPALYYFEKYYFQFNILFLAGIFIVCNLLNKASLFYFLGPLRIVTVWHSTWLINSFSHKQIPFVRRSSYKLIDSNFICILIGGDGYHCSHHENPSQVSAKQGRQLGFDYGAHILGLLKKFGVVNFKN